MGVRQKSNFSNKVSSSHPGKVDWKIENKAETCIYVSALFFNLYRTMRWDKDKK